ncbi:MAG: cytochrome c family protein [Pseudomonadota bacterium]
MISKLLKGALAAAMLSVAPVAAVAQDMAAEVAALGGDAKAGKKVYRKCKACHVIDKDKNRVGPHQVGIIGRPAAAIEGFKYSDAMIAKGEEGLVWNVETLSAYLADPKGYIEGTKMAFAGLKKEDDIANVITYMAEEGGIFEATN